ncbi:glycosyltransferase family 2 protein [Algoriphagus sp.]|uniref:glycosyltransferase family 2 protein n=1 Tax=Algoriphagus sp. TaxID=1872435 RepID=UPI0025F5029C|nr:glycosyltransferase family 2 protein [Algoriphagus sp.]
MKSCAIVILNYNGEEMLKKFLPSVLAHSQLDIWVIDNASSDQSISILKNEFPTINLILLKENFGFAGGYNWGLSELEGKYHYYILLNSDVEVTPNWDLNLVSYASSLPEYAAFQPKILSYQDPQKFDYAGAGGGFIDALGYPYCRGRIWEHIENDNGQYDDSIDVDWASGACMLVKAEVFHSLSGFDAHFFAHMEEIDLCWRMRNLGWKVGYFGGVKVYHIGGATLNRNSPKKLFLNIRNNLMMIYKNERGVVFWMIFLAKLFFEMIAAILFLVKGEKENAKSIARGYREFISNRNLSKRQKIISNQELAISSRGPVRFLILKTGLLRRKTFNSL